jgi:dGTPase
MDRAGYGQADQARWVTEPPKRPGRTEFARDRARVLHSAALRRLGATTQVAAPGDSDFPRTRLTHSLECGQIGRELGQALGADPDLVEVACLAHDLGHPPFGHTGEEALNSIAELCGGFEGNAQSLRILTRLEAKSFSASGYSAGLNLTRAALDAATKYPWPRRKGIAKYGVYDDDRRVFDFVRSSTAPDRRCIEAQVMDWSDDIAYSVHDLEDGLHAGHVHLSALVDAQERYGLAGLAAARYAPDIDTAELASALERLADLPYWPQEYDGSQRSLAGLKNATSQLIGRFCQATEQSTRAVFSRGPLTRYAADVIIPDWARAECAILKAVTARYVMGRDAAERRYSLQRELMCELVDLVMRGAPNLLEAWIRPEFEAASCDAARLRVVIDQVASLTDASAVAWSQRLRRSPGTSIGVAP